MADCLEGKQDGTVEIGEPSDEELQKDEGKPDDILCGYEQDFNPQQLQNTADFISKYEKVTVIVAGKPRMGKSTAFNNLFGLSLDAGPGAHSVTKDVADNTITQNGVSVRYIDTPGLQAVDLSSKKVLRDICRSIEQGDDSFTLLYCVSASSGFTKDDIKIVKKLDKLYSHKIWKRCILILTNCDLVRRENFCSEKEDENYIECLKSFVSEFEQILIKCNVQPPPVKLIFDCQNGGTVSGIAGGMAAPGAMEMQDVGAIANPIMVPQTRPTIVAFPVAKSKKAGMEARILPGIEIPGNLDWSDIVFMEVLHKSGRFAISLARFRYNLIFVVPNKVTLAHIMSKLITILSKAN